MYVCVQHYVRSYVCQRIIAPQLCRCQQKRRALLFLPLFFLLYYLSEWNLRFQEFRKLSRVRKNIIEKAWAK